MTGIVFCQRCDGQFVRLSGVARFCGDECRLVYAAEVAGGPRQRRVCQNCGASYKPKSTTRVTFCSRDCSFVFRKREKEINGPRQRRIHRATRRLRERGVGHELVDPFEVFARDGWRCRLCGVATPRKLRGTVDKRAPELDHIIPLSLGGEHSYRNTQCACKGCNSSKGRKPLGQLRLFG